MTKTSDAASITSAMAALRAAAWPCHQRLEKRIDVKSRFSERASYLAYLQKMWGFCAAVEQQAQLGGVVDALADFESRQKLPLLGADLMALGMSAPAVAGLTRCDRLPACPDAAAALGCFYVLEGATLGGRTLLPVVERNLGLSAAHGASFLASYGERVQEMWTVFGKALESWCHTDARRARAASGAVATFEALESWFCT